MYIKNTRQVPGDDFTRIEWARLPDSHYRLLIGLRLLADVGGANVIDLHRIRREVWQAGEEGASWPTIDDVETWMLELAVAGWLDFYTDPKGSGTELFRIVAPWPKPQKQGFPKWEPPPENSREIAPFRKPVVGGERAGVCAGESARAGEGERARASSSGSTKLPKLRITPSRFCSEHPGGPPERIDCRDCGTARLRQEEHKEARTALVQAQQLPPALRGPVVAQLEAKLAALEEAAAQALMPTADTDEDPTEFIDGDGRIEST